MIGSLLGMMVPPLVPNETRSRRPRQTAKARRDEIWRHVQLKAEAQRWRRSLKAGDEVLVYRGEELPPDRRVVAGGTAEWVWFDDETGAKRQQCYMP